MLTSPPLRLNNNSALPVEIELLDSAQTLALDRQLRAIYLAAFSAPPYERDEATATLFVADTLRRHAPRDGFRCAVARRGGEGDLVGFAYGYTGAVGQWWTDAVARQMPPSLAELWLPDHFEMVELAVLPALHGKGIGGRLHDALLAGLHHPRAMLSTAQVWTPARALYDKRGWQVLLPHFLFPGSSRPYVIMGKEL